MDLDPKSLLHIICCVKIKLMSNTSSTLPDELFIASLPIEVPANLANLASLCIGDFLESIFESIVAALSLFPVPFPLAAISIVISHAATDNEHFFPRIPEPFKKVDYLSLIWFGGCKIKTA